jgi:hypothetical protein
MFGPRIYRDSTSVATSTAENEKEFMQRESDELVGEMVRLDDHLLILAVTETRVIGTHALLDHVAGLADTLRWDDKWVPRRVAIQKADSASRAQERSLRD